MGGEEYSIAVIGTALVGKTAMIQLLSTIEDCYIKQVLVDGEPPNKNMVYKRPIGASEFENLT